MSIRTRMRRTGITAVSAVLLTTAALTGMLAVGAPAAEAVPSTYWVSPTGSGTDCTQASPCALETAVRDTDASGGVVKLLGTSYTGVSIEFIANAAVTIEAAPGAHPVLTGVPGDIVIEDRGDTGSLTVSGLEISGGSSGVLSWVALTVQDAYIHDAQQYGVKTIGSTTPTMEVDNSTIAHNGVVGVLTAGASRIFASTIYQNTLVGVETHGPEPLTILSSTLFGNGNHNVEPYTDNLTIGGSILGGETGQAYSCYRPAGVDAGGNISGDTSCHFSAASSVNLSTTLDASVGALTDNGGPTPTVALSSGSPAIGLVPATVSDGGTSLCAQPDQRGQARTAPCDAGAYQTPPKTSSSSPTITNLPASPQWGDQFTAIVTTTGDGAKSVTSSTTSVCTVDGDGLTVHFLTPGTCTLVAHVTAGATHSAADGTAQDVAVAKTAPTTPSISNVPGSPQIGDSFTAAVNTTGDGTKSVTSSTTGVCTVDNGDHLTVSFVAAGTCTLTAHVSAGATHTAGDGSAQSVTVPAANTAPSVTTNPSDKTVTAGGTASFTAAASGSPVPTVQWQVDTGSGFDNIAGATSTTLTFTATAGMSGNKYRAVFSNSSGSDTSTAATLTVNTAPSVTTNPSDKTVNAGGTVTFSAAASGSPAPTVQWQVDAGSGFGNIAGATSTTLTFTATAGMSGNKYRAVFTNSAGSDTTASATLTVTTAPVVSTNPSDKTVNAGDTATFTASASGSPTPTVQWQVDAGAGFNDMPGATSTTLTLSGVTAVMSGNKYRAVFTNNAGSDTSTAATLTVNTAPVVTTNPSDKAVNSGGTASFTAAASGSPTPTVQWQVDTGSGFGNIVGATSTTLTFTATAGMSGNKYQAVFTNAAGSDTTTAATLTVNTAPLVTTNPSDKTVTAGGTAIFTAAASGNPTPMVQWQVDAGAGFNNMPGATSATLTLSGVTPVMNGNKYRAVFTNSAGDDTTTAATLTVNTPAALTGDSTATGKVGNPFTYSYTVSGSPAPTVLISGDTLPAGVTFNSTAKTIAGTPAAGTAGTYHLTLTAHNGIGDDATLSITLTITPESVDGLAPTITGLAQVGQTLTAHPGPVSPSNAALTYQWKANGTPIANATASTYKLKTAQAGKTITVTITASSPPLTPQTKTSDPTPYVRAKVDGDEIKLDQSSAARGGSLGLLGKGLVPGATYQVTIGGVSLGSFTADEYGEINQTVTIPTTVKTGIQVITITAPSGDVASTVVLVTDSPPRASV